MIGLDVYAAGCPPLTHCVLHSRVGDLSDTATDYDAGVGQVLALVQFFDALGRPKEFEAAVQGVYRKYESARLSKVLYAGGIAAVAAAKYNAATPMKIAGADAAVLMQKIQQAMPAKAAAVPSELKNPVYDPTAESKLDKLMSWSIPWYVYAGLIIAALGAGAYYLWPVLAPMLARRKK